MDGGAKKLLETVTYETLHAHNFSRSSSQATSVLTDLLSRYLALLTTTCAQYAQHAGRLSLSIRDAVSALDELGVGVEELNEYCATEGRDLSRYAVHTARRIEDLNDFKASLAVGLREDRDDAIPLVYARMPTPTEGTSDSEEEEVEEEADAILMDCVEEGEEDWTKSRDALASIPPPATPPLPLSPISNPSTPPRKRPRTASWRSPPHIPDFLPPFPTDTPRHSPSPTPPDASVVPETTVKLERPASPSPPQIASSSSSTDYLTPIPYSQSSLAQITSRHLPSAPPAVAASNNHNHPRLPVPQMQPSLLGAYHHVLTHPPPTGPQAINPARYRVALAFLAQAEKNPRWDHPATLFANSTPNAPRVAAMGPSFPVPISKLPPTPNEGKTEKESESSKDHKSNLPPAPPKPVVSSERVAPSLNQQGSRFPVLARQVLPSSVFNRSTRLTHPPILQRGSQRLTYGPGVNAPWNTNAPPTPNAPGPGKKELNGLPNGKDKDSETQVQSLQDARYYATWDYDQKRFNEPLVVRRGRGQATMTLPPVRGRTPKS